MKNDSSENNFQFVASFQELITKPFKGEINALCYHRELKGDFAEIIAKVNSDENIIDLNEEDLLQMSLSAEGQLAREILINDLQILKAQGAAPLLNLITSYDRDETSFFPTDVYSFHVDRSPIPTSTFLCTYYGAPSEIVANDQARQKILIPELRAELKKLYDGPDENFETFLSEHFFDLHYQAKPNAHIINLGRGNLWKLSTDHPGNNVLPCIHRAPKERAGEKRLLLIC